MKTFFCFLLSGIALQAQVATILENGPHHRVVEVSKTEEVNGLPVERKWKYLELANGLNYFDGQEWVEANPTYVETQEGYSLTKAQYQLNVAANMLDPVVVTYQTPEGKLFRSNPGFLAYRDTSSGQAVAIAEVKESVARLAGTDEVYWDDCFVGLHASIRVKAAKEGMEQDVLLLGEVPTPDEYNLNPATTQLEMWTEFLEAATPDKVTTREVNGMPDVQLDFGKTSIGTGHAFLMINSDKKIPVAKRFGRVEAFNSTFMVEVVRYAEAGPLIEDLQASLPKDLKKIRTMAKVVKSDRELVASRSVKRRDQAAMRKRRNDQALLGPRPANAFVIDYSTVSGNYTNMVFDASMTTYISGNVTLRTTGGASTIFEGGTVIKFAPGGTVSMTLESPADFRTTPWRPVILTARDDHTIGEQIGTASLANGSYANIALNLNSTASGVGYGLKHLRIVKAKTGIALNARNDHDFWHVQMVDCETGISATTAQFTLRNALFSGVANAFAGGTATGRVEHLTLDRANWLNKSSQITLLCLTNSLLTSVTNLGTYTAQNVTSLSSSNGIFQGIGAGAYYLANNSPYRKAGTTGIHTNLASDLRQRTTYPPEALSGLITLDTTLRQKVLRGQATPDLGFSYVPIDWGLAVTVTNATLTLAEGVSAVAYGASAGVWVHDGGKFITRGRADRRVHLGRYGVFQEQPLFWPTAYSPGFQFVVAANYNTGTGPEIQCIHTDWDAASGYGAHLWSGDAPYDAKKLWVQNCEFNSSGVTLGGATSGAVGITNNLFIRASLAYQGKSALTACNNLTYGGEYLLGRPTGAGTWTFTDNHLHSTYVVNGGLSINSRTNVYSAGSDTFNIPTTGDIVTNYFVFENGIFGNFYQPTASLFVNKGSQTNATYVGMYHFTIHSNQAKETASWLDAGYHLTATSGNMLADADGDGIPDVIEDPNGNGVYDSTLGETDLGVYTSTLGSTTGPGLITFTPLK